MKAFARCLLLLLVLAASLPAAEGKAIMAVRAADAERVAATLAADPARLAAILSDDLRYAHSNGKVEDKAAFVRSLTSRSVVYESFDYQSLDFRAVSPGVVLMTGRVIARAISGGQPVALDLNFLAVWREEGGQWRFLAWQSSRNPPPAPRGQ